MKVGHVFKIDDIQYCICDIKKVNDREVAYAISWENENTKITFFKLEYDENGVSIEEIKDSELITNLFRLFLNEN